LDVRYISICGLASFMGSSERHSYQKVPCFQG
jgi:hypothetical protein